MEQDWFEVQWHLGKVQVTRQSGKRSRPRPGNVLVKMISCGICAADVRAITGNKSISEQQGRYIIPGHEGFGRVITAGRKVTHFQPGVERPESVDCPGVVPARFHKDVHVLSVPRLPRPPADAVGPRQDEGDLLFLEDLEYAV